MAPRVADMTAALLSPTDLVDEALVPLDRGLVLLPLQLQPALALLLHLLGVVDGQLSLLGERLLQHLHRLGLVVQLHPLGQDRGRHVRCHSRRCVEREAVHVCACVCVCVCVSAHNIGALTG